MHNPLGVSVEQPQETDELVAQRLAKLASLRARGVDPFAAERFDRTHLAEEVRERFDALAESGEKVAVCGRIVAIRTMGKAAFVHILDASGRIQVYFKLDNVGPEAFSLLEFFDVGDFLGIHGPVFRTRTGEITIQVQTFDILGKALRPLPVGKQKGEEQWYALQDVEQRYRQRYLDLIVNPRAREPLLKRIQVVSEVRRFLEGRGFLEVETPVLQPLAGGAAARPFLTHHNALDADLHLRISLELYLKRLVVGNLEKVFEMSKVFRNEGISPRHNPEYTLLEVYEAYTDLEGMMALTESLVDHVTRALYGGRKFTYAGTEIDVTPPWPRRSMMELLEACAGLTRDDFATLARARAAGERLGLPMEKEHTIGGIIDKVFEKACQPGLVQPAFVTDFPLDLSPLAKKKPGDPWLTRRFEAHIAGQEIANAFSEVNDPIDQRQRFEEQRRMREAGEEDAHPYDADFLRALEHGMPPTGGLGIGIDRLAALLADVPSLRDVIFFPQMRPE
ncbi:MAG: lysine--tRNA ligase [Armatimonadetes bacterium]|nr:lysine--tRNA ligase [Armatimonadota bacterium]